MRHWLGLTYLPDNARKVQCDCGRHIYRGDLDHARTCPKLAGIRTLRHDILKKIGSRLGNLAGISTSEEPTLRELQDAGDGANANRPESRGDVLFALTDGLTVGNVSVHPAGPIYCRAAALAYGAAAAKRDREKQERYATADPHGYAFVPLVVLH